MDGKGSNGKGLGHAVSPSDYVHSHPPNADSIMGADGRMSPRSILRLFSDYK